MITLQSTARCGRTPDVLFALEELGVSYELERVDEGYFTKAYGRMGPVLRDGDLVAFEPAAIIRHLARRARGTPLWPGSDDDVCRAEQWMDFSMSQVRPAAGRLFAMKMSGAPEEAMAGEHTRLTAALTVIDRAVEGRDYLLGRFTLADCSFVGLSMIAMLGGFEHLRALKAYSERLMARPAAQRVTQRA